MHRHYYPGEIQRTTSGLVQFSLDPDTDHGQRRIRSRRRKKVTLINRSKLIWIKVWANDRSIHQRTRPRRRRRRSWVYGEMWPEIRWWLMVALLGDTRKSRSCHFLIYVPLPITTLTMDAPEFYYTPGYFVFHRRAVRHCGPGTGTGYVCLPTCVPCVLHGWRCVEIYFSISSTGLLSIDDPFERQIGILFQGQSICLRWIIRYYVVVSSPLLISTTFSSTTSYT